MSDLPSRVKWNVPHAPEYAWDIAAEMTSLERRQVAARWLEGRLVDREAIDIEAVAAVEHDQWAHWTAYMLDNLTEVNIARWRQQIECPYPALTETEKDSDREWANKAVDAALGEET